MAGDEGASGDAPGELDYRLLSIYQEGAPELENESISPLYEDLQGLANRYRNFEQIAKGGMKRIYRVFDVATNRYVAMAKLHGNAPSELVEPFLREAHLTASLDHPNVVDVHDVGVNDEGEPYFTMVLQKGRTLTQVMRTVESAQARRRWLLGIFVQICDAMAYSHSRGVLHLDLKPDNIQVGDFNEVVLCDWGLAKIIGSEVEDAEFDELLLSPDLLNNMTLSGMVRGTPGYMAPEQIHKETEPDERTDVYALGCLLYVLLTLKVPYEGESPTIVEQTLEGSMCPPAERAPEAEVPVGLSAVVMKATQTRPRDRYRDVGTLRREVENYLGGHATDAENAGVPKQLKLLYQRNRRFCNTIMVSGLCLVAGTGFFVNELQNSEHAARVAQHTAESNLESFIQERKRFEKLNKDFTASLLEDNRQLIRAADFDRAIEKIQNAIEKDPDNPVIWRQMGHTLFVMQRFEAAVRCFDEIEDRGLMPSVAKELAKEKPDDQLLPPERIAEVMRLFPTQLPLKFKMQLYDSVARASVDEHAIVVAAAVEGANPNWANRIFEYDSYRKSLRIGGTGLMILRRHDKGRNSILTTLPIRSLIIEASGISDAADASIPGLVDLDIAQTDIVDLEKKAFPSLRKVVVSKKFSKERMEVLREHFIIRVRQDLRK